MTARYWWGEVDESGAAITASSDDGEALLRIASLESPMDGTVPGTWEAAVACGAVPDRAAYLARLHTLAMRLAADRVADALRGPDLELLQMVRTLDELDGVINLLTERAVEWYATQDPKFTRKFRAMPARRLVQVLSPRARGPLRAVLVQVEALGGARSELAREVTRVAFRVMPNSSELVGGLVAARLMAAAGSLDALARLPASGLQVLGAKSALFSHIRAGTPPPKHGLIFQHRRVHNAPLAVQGRVARVLASRLAIAARIDRYRGDLDPAFIESSNARIDGVLA